MLYVVFMYFLKYILKYTYIIFPSCRLVKWDLYVCDKELTVFIIHAEQETFSSVGYDSLEFYCMVRKQVSSQP